MRNMWVLCNFENRTYLFFQKMVALPLLTMFGSVTLLVGVLLILLSEISGVSAEDSEKTIVLK